MVSEENVLRAVRFLNANKRIVSVGLDIAGYLLKGASYAAMAWGLYGVSHGIKNDEGIEMVKGLSAMFAGYTIIGTINGVARHGEVMSALERISQEQTKNPKEETPSAQ